MTTLNHNIFNLRNLFIGLVIFGFIILAVVMFRGCDNTPSHAVEAKEVKALQAALQQKEEQAHQDSIQLAGKLDSLRIANLDLQNKKDVIARELAITKSKVIKLANSNERAKADSDTARYIETCDSLKDLAKLQAEVIGMYQENDSLRTANYEAQLSAKDSLLISRATLIVQLRNTNNQTYAGYQALHADYLKVTRKMKRERTLGRVLAGAGVVLGTLLLTK